ncbi:hypothetical protein L0Y59_03150 [Candidatus Uhrbacteria bacterium]|nr:hypothetical protein [Candidatus Uhrbacteria bacterium]
MMSELIPAILVQDEQTFHERVKLMENLVTTVHLDVMDGVFVPNRSWFDAVALAALQTPLRFEIHLMVTDPRRALDDLLGISSVLRPIWHVETDADHRGLIDLCRAASKEAGIAINPATPIDRLVSLAPHLDEILVMGAEPGFSGRAMTPAALERAWEIHGRWPERMLGFDIGVNAETIPKLKQAGVTRFCAASAIFNAKDPTAETKRLLALL